MKSHVTELSTARTACTCLSPLTAFQLLCPCGHLEFTCISDCFWTNKTLEQKEIHWYIIPHWQFDTTKRLRALSLQSTRHKNVFYSKHHKSKPHAQTLSVGGTVAPTCFEESIFHCSNAGFASCTGTSSVRLEPVNSTSSNIPLRGKSFTSVPALIFVSQSTGDETGPRSMITQALLLTVKSFALPHYHQASPTVLAQTQKEVVYVFFSICGKDDYSTCIIFCSIALFWLSASTFFWWCTFWYNHQITYLVSFVFRYIFPWLVASHSPPMRATTPSNLSKKKRAWNLCTE